MGIALVGVGLLGFLASLVLLIMRAIRRKGKLGAYAIALGMCFVLVIVGSVASSGSKTNTSGGFSSTSVAIPVPTPTESPEDYKKLAKPDLTYTELLRNTEKYVGTRVLYTGKVIQALEKPSGNQATLKMQMRIAVTRGNYDIWDDAVFVDYTGPRLLEGDIVKFWGTVEGRLTYKAVLGNEITIPEITAKYVEVIEARK